jgi:predicted Fe-Mo cluster-binding NifX family protein
MRAMQLTSSEMYSPETSDEQQANLAGHMEMLMGMLGTYSIALDVVRTIGEAALQGLANTGIRVPEAAPILAPDGSVLSQPHKPRSKRKGS